MENNTETEQIISNLDKFIANRDITALGHWYSKGIEWIQNYILEKAVSTHGEVFKQRVINTAKKVRESNMENIGESTTTASVGGQYVTPFFLKKKKINEDGSNALEYGTYRDLFKYIVSTQVKTDNEAFAHDLNDFQIEVALASGNLDQEVSDEALAKLEDIFVKHGVEFSKGESQEDFVSGDVEFGSEEPTDLIEVTGGEMTNMELFELSEGIIGSLEENSPYKNKIISVLESILNVDEPQGVVDVNDLSELYNLVREMENGGTIEDYFQTEIAIPSLNEEKLKAEKILSDVHSENKSNEPEQVEPVKGDEGEVDSENQKAEPELGDGESEFKRASKGMEDIDYDAISNEDKERHKELIDQDIESDSVEDQNGFKVDKMENPNAIESDVAEDMIKTAEENSKKDLEDPHYVKDPQPVKVVKESVEDDNEIVREGDGYQITRAEDKIIKEEVEMINKFLNFNPKQSTNSRNKNKVDVLQIIRDLNKK